ncbi:MGH1-like glycoside hydrolase domain-containing protein [Actinoplanes regularis]|uniref:Glycosyl hydrolase family 63 C-terminal domain-containing protein n=1 Tax=Actinoplanes regularis TaxID=52697 RepID=A0A239HYB3_9ACTN|nr:glucosidase [Actinoplanes regularis]GIE91233.1 glucosidase [Actinoplanes regularis]SNS85214.1 Glycosyl hydrolase family 63 C-terminal domain-containing protein [Actinoplanes regularis]
MSAVENAEQRRLRDADTAVVDWRRWGPYLSERQWGTVREDYSPGGDAWDHLTHDQARSRAYRWGEDGIAGFSDDRQQLCLAVALWNGRDPILKERFFGLTNAEGNHGEDVKEYYFYVDGTPTHSYLRMVYKYPQREFPYEDLVATNRARGRNEFEYELLDTGIFAEDRYFDVVVEYAKAGPEEILTRITVHNRGPEEAVLHLLPTVWFRNTGAQARLYGLDAGVVRAEHDRLGQRWWTCLGEHPLLFTENADGRKDAFGRYLIQGEKEAVNAGDEGGKAAAVVTMVVPAGGEYRVRAKLSDQPPTAADRDDHAFDEVVEARRAEADEFYADLFAPALGEPQRQVVRQALAGMIWSKQYFGYDVEQWLTEHGRNPLDAPGIRNGDWFHLDAHDIISMPDTWEYPWFAAWDLAFQSVAFAAVDLGFAKGQLDLLLSRRYLHPNGQIPAYEWNFGDVNPPVHAWATYLVYELEKARTGQGDHDWLERIFHKLAKNFTWWVNRKDVDGRNVFQGGFLGLDNIGVFDRSAPLPTGGHLDQADGTAWMALYCQNMLQIALELAVQDPVYLEQAQTYFEHFAWISTGSGSMWDEEDGFYYDLLRLPDGSSQRLRVRSMVGLLPLAAATVYDRALLDRHPEIIADAQAFLERHETITMSDGRGRLLALFDEGRLRRILARMLDEEEFLSPYGIRALSKFHAANPFEFRVGDQVYDVSYQPAESDSGMFGGNSNWRGPIWFPVNALVIRSLLNLYVAYGDEFTVECPTGSGVHLTLFEVAREISDRLTRIFVPGPDGRRPCYGGQEVFAGEHWREMILFAEYFHGDNGAGLGAAHQTGWTGLVALFPNLFAGLTGKKLLQDGMAGVFRKFSGQEES